MKQRYTAQIGYWLKVVALGVVLGFGIQFAQAWTNPSAPAPTGNLAGPINTGIIDQVKNAGLGLVGNLVVGSAAAPKSICLNGACITAWPTGGATLGQNNCTCLWTRNFVGTAACQVGYYQAGICGNGEDGRHNGIYCCRP